MSRTPDTRPVVTFRIDPELLDGLRELWDRDGIAQSEAIRRALRTWLTERGVLVATDKPKRSTRSKARRPRPRT